MKTRWPFAALAAAVSIGFFAGTGLSEDPAPGEEEMKKMMEQMLELGKPTEAHAALEAMQGTWDGESTFWMPNGGEPITSSSTSVNALIMGGRFLQSDYSGDFMGRPFTGLGLMGYDNFKEQYQGLWIDSWTSGMAWETGNASEDGQTITLEGVWESPMGKSSMRHVYTLVGPDEYKLEGYVGQGGQEMKNMQIVFKRRKPLVFECRPRRHVPSKGPGY